MCITHPSAPPDSAQQVRPHAHAGRRPHAGALRGPQPPPRPAGGILRPVADLCTCTSQPHPNSPTCMRPSIHCLPSPHHQTTTTLLQVQPPSADRAAPLRVSFTCLPVVGGPATPGCVGCLFLYVCYVLLGFGGSSVLHSPTAWCTHSPIATTNAQLHAAPADQLLQPVLVRPPRRHQRRVRRPRLVRPVPLFWLSRHK